MLKRLYIENFAIANKLEIKFHPGMNVLTGETGAGKSIIVGAIALLMGEKASHEDIRSGSEMSIIEGDFSISKQGKILEKLNEFEIEYSEILTIRREIFQSKSSRAFINNQLVTLTQLRGLTGHLAELHGQHSHQLLLDEKNHLAFLDRFAGLTDKANRLRSFYTKWDYAGKKLAHLKSQIAQEKNQQELLQFQAREIEKAGINPGEEEELLAEKKIIDSSRELFEKSSAILEKLDREELSALVILSDCRKELSRMLNLDESLSESGELLEQSIINLEEFRSQIETYQSDIPDDPKRQEKINLRLDEIFKLKSKYGGSENSIIATFEKINKQLQTSTDITENIQHLEKEVSTFFNKYSSLGREIAKNRRDAALVLSQKVVNELKQLNIDSARFQFEFIFEPDEKGVELNGRRVKPDPEGLETGRFLISANPGEPLKALARTASGGEISRIMLALKAADKRFKVDHNSLLVFDEIDVGIGGLTAKAVAKKLAAISKKFQLLVITHLHQIADRGDKHYAVEKITEKDTRRNIVSVRELDKPARAGEIERMLAVSIKPD